MKLDAMFFSADEKPIVLWGDGSHGTGKNNNSVQQDDGDNESGTISDESQINKNSLNYLNYDTIILCNPNAMQYQNMINYPHAYYLKFFLNKQINCFVWNYRGYGRTGGSLTTSLIEQDAEQILNFLKLRIGVKGKIGIYGRSLGCCAVSCLQDKVDLAIADRGFGDLWTLADKKFNFSLAE